MTKEKDKEKEKYYIRERWNMCGDVEKYDEKTTPANTVIGLKKVKAWIEDWIETWKENAEDNGYKFLGFKTDYKTFARLRIHRGKIGEIPMIDNFSLKVIKA